MNVGLQPDYYDLRLGIGWPLYAGPAPAMTKGIDRPSVLVPSVPKRNVEPALERVEEAVTSAQLDVSLPPVRSGVVCCAPAVPQEEHEREGTAGNLHLLRHPDDGADGVGQSCIDGEDALGHQEPPARGRDDERRHVTGIAEGCAEGGSSATFAGSPASMRCRIVTGADVPFAAAASIAARTMRYPLRADRARCPRAAPASPLQPVQ